MSVPEQKRCFECGATYPPEVLVCANDGTPLCFDTVGRRWKIEGIIGRRPGGAIFSGFHLVSGQRAAIDLLPGENAREATALTRFDQQLQALRILDQNKSILRLIEDGTERDGSRFMVTELGKLRQLQDLIDEWQRPEGVLMEPTEAAQLVTPLLALLTTAARVGMAHGSLDATQIYVGSDNDFVSGLGTVATVKLHGLGSLGMGAPLRAAQAADLRGLGRVLYELCTGKLPPDSEVLLRAALPQGLLGPLGPVVLRAIGAPGQVPFASADELRRALSAATVGGRGGPPAASPAASTPAVEPVPVASSGPAVPKYLSLPPTPSAPGLPNLRSFPPGASLPPVRVTAPHMVVPAPLAAMKSAPQRGGLTSELRQVSILDLMQEMKEQQETTAREETLARSRHRPSLNNIKLPPLASPGEVAAEAPSAAEPPTASPVAAAPSLNAPQATVEGNKSGDVLEPTVDRQDLPVGFEPGQPSRVSVRGLEAPAPAAASANSAGAPPAVPAPSPSEPAGPVPPVPVDSARSPAAAPPVAPLSPAIEPTGGAASSTSPAAPAAAPLVKAAAPIPPVVPGELPRWAWLAVLGPLIAIILGLVVILLTR